MIPALAEEPLYFFHGDSGGYHTITQNYYPQLQSSPDVVTCWAKSKNCKSVTVAWKANPSPFVTGYAVYRNGALVAKGAGTSMIDSSVQSGKTYKYWVETMVGTVQSKPSATVTITIP